MSDKQRYGRVLAAARQLRGQGVSFEDALPTLRQESSSIIDSIKAGRDAYGLELDASKLLVHASDAWSDCRDAFDRLHADAERAADQVSSRTLSNER